jgi:2-methylisocitrate lyase-like PEP mutase family enzyme
VPDRRRALRAELSRPGVCLLPGVASALDARLAERAGFRTVFTTGAGIANATLGIPDLGLTTMTEICTVTARIADAVGIPVIADADTGYGNHLNAMRTAAEFERAGVAGLVIEDQVSPKRCGHFEGKRVVTPQEMVEKIAAVRAGRRDPDLVLVARTDAIAPNGFADALERANLYLEAGADVAFVEAPRDADELAAIPREVSGPCLVNMVEGGVTPILPAAELGALGFKFVLYANLALRVAAHSVQRAFRTLALEGSSRSLGDAMLGWDERQELVGLPRWRELDGEVAATAAALMREDADGRVSGG